MATTTKQTPGITKLQGASAEPPPKRILGYDVARALAILGMVVVNFKIVMGAETGPAALRWAAGLFEGRAAAVFVVLAGVGLSLLSAKGRIHQNAQQIHHDQWVLRKRALFLFGVGLLFAPIWPPDILHFYGVYLLIGSFLLAAPNRRLWWWALCFTLGFVALLLVLDYEAGWDWETLTYVDFWSVRGMLRHLFFNGFHPVFPWTSFLLVGLWLGRQDVVNPRLRRRLLVWSLLVAGVVEAFSFLLSHLFSGDLALLWTTHPLPPTPFYIAASTATAVAVIMLCLEITMRYDNAGWLQPVVATGQLALTLYVAHVILGMGFLELLGRLENQSIQFALCAALVFWLLAMLFAHYWRKRFQRGPLEWVMRTLTTHT